MGWLSLFAPQHRSKIMGAGRNMHFVHLEAYAYGMKAAL